MRVACIRAHGGLEALRHEDWPDPVPGPGQALVEVGACGLNHLDLFVIKGMAGVDIAFPRITGGDIAGIVSATCSPDDRAWIGRRVLVDPLVVEGRNRMALGEHRNGGLCERLCVSVGNLIALPEDVSLERAAALPIAYGTAHKMLGPGRGDLKRGETMLVLGATGGVGVASVQLGKLMGARVIACTSSAEKAGKLAALGADAVIDTSREEFSAAAWRLTDKQGADVVVNFTGGETWVPGLRALKRLGRVLVCGATAGYDPVEDLRYLWMREAAIIGSNGWERENLTALVDLVARGALSPVIDRVLPLAETASALAALRDRRVFGKVLIKP